MAHGITPIVSFAIFSKPVTDTKLLIPNEELTITSSVNKAFGVTVAAGAGPANTHINLEVISDSVMYV